MQEPSKSQTPQESQRQQADFARQAKELDAREEYLTEREALLESGPIDLTVLEESIRVKTGQLEQIKATFLKKEKWYKERLERYDVQLAESKKELDIRNEAVELEIETFNRTAADLLETTDAMKKINATISERKRYLDEQEHIIAETIDEGNATLRGIGYEITAAQGQRDQLTVEVAEIETRKTDLAYELVQLEDRATHDKFNIENELEALRMRVSDEGQKFIDIRAEQKKATQHVDEKLRSLSIKEQELTVKQDAIRKERQQLDEDKRRYNSAKSLYDL